MDIKQLIGKKQKEGREICEKNNYFVIIKRKDNLNFKYFEFINDKMNSKIINFELDDDIITNCYFN